MKQARATFPTSVSLVVIAALWLIFSALPAEGRIGPGVGLREDQRQLGVTRVDLFQAQLDRPKAELIADPDVSALERATVDAGAVAAAEIRELRIFANAPAQPGMAPGDSWHGEHQIVVLGTADAILSRG